MPEFPPLWFDFQRFETNTALTDAATGHSVTYGELLNLIASAERFLPRHPKLLVALKVRPTIESIAIYLGALRAGHALLLSSTISLATIRAYKPDFIVLDEEDDQPDLLADFVEQSSILGHKMWTRRSPNSDAIDSALALLMPTSGTTGTRRFIKLSYQNIHAGARQVVSGLSVTSADRAITNLSLDYVYGLSVLHSHLISGARIVLEKNSFVSQKFWESFRTFGITGFGGVPFTYQTLHGMKFDRFELPSLKTLTQAGGPLSAELRSWLIATFVPRGVRVYFMYGLSEATGRVTILPQESLEQHPNSVGMAVPFGVVSIGENEEILYRGPNVMLGYAMGRDDLCIGDTVGGMLHTGDLGFLTPDGHLYIKGRLSRFGKVFGQRVALDELEQEYAGGGILCMDAFDDKLHVYHDGSALSALRAQVTKLCRSLQVPPQAVRPCEIDEIPRTANGKTDYPRLRELASRSLDRR